MFVRLVLTHKRGVPLPKRRIARSAELVGNVLTEYHDDRHLGRTVLVASFRVENMIGTAPMHLFEPRCVLIGQDGMILGGLEREAVESGFTEMLRAGGCAPSCRRTERAGVTTTTTMPRAPTAWLAREAICRGGPGGWESDGWRDGVAAVLPNIRRACYNLADRSDLSWAFRPCAAIA